MNLVIVSTIQNLQNTRTCTHTDAWKVRGSLQVFVHFGRYSFVVDGICCNEYRFSFRFCSAVILAYPFDVVDVRKQMVSCPRSVHIHRFEFGIDHIYEFCRLNSQHTTYHTINNRFDRVYVWEKTTDQLKRGNKLTKKTPTIRRTDWKFSVSWLDYSFSIDFEYLSISSPSLSLSAHRLTLDFHCEKKQYFSY